MNVKSSTQTTPEPSQKRFIALAIPNMLTSITIPIVGLVDMAFLGHLDSPYPLAGVALATILFDFLFWGFGFLRISTTGLTSQAFGADNTREVDTVFWAGIVMAVTIACAIMLLQSPISDVAFVLLGASGEAHVQALEYYSIRIWAALPLMIIYVICGWLMGLGMATRVFILVGLLQLVNVVLDYVFIYRMDMGAYGAGLATTIAEWVGCAGGIVMLMTLKQSFPSIHEDLLWHAARFKHVITFNVNLMIRTWSLIGVFMLFTRVSSTMGVVTLAANSILLRLLHFAAHFVDGYAGSLEILAGQYKGAGKKAAQLRVLKMALIWNGLTMLAYVLLMILIKEPLAHMLVALPEVQQEIISTLPYVVLTLLVAGFSYILDGYFFGLTEGKVLRNSMFFAAIIGFVPLALLAEYHQSTLLLWSAWTAFCIIRTAGLSYAAWRGFKNTEST